MGGSKDPDKGPSTQRPLPRSLAMSNESKAAHIHREVEQAVERSGPLSCLHIQALAVYMVLIPPLELLAKRVRENITKILLDFSIWRKLEDAGVINWCLSAEKLFPLWTKGDGNCLPHSVSLYLWGVHDDNLFLRGLIYETLSDAPTAEQFRDRWKHARRYMNSTIPEGGVQYDSREWDEEWIMAVELASDTRQDHDPNVLPYKSLEEIHIFVLANIIRRPIIVLSEAVIRRIDGSSLAPNYIGGIYLPTLCKPKECIKSPVILCYDSNHFVPLLSMEVPKDTTSHTEPIVPIVSSNLETLPVHLLVEEEEKRVTQLLEEYLNLTEVRRTRSTQVDDILAVAIHHRQLPQDLNLMGDFCAAVDTYVLGEHQSKGLKMDRSDQKIGATVEMHEEQSPPYQRVGGSFRPNPGGHENPHTIKDPPETFVKSSDHFSKPELPIEGREEESSPTESIPLAVQVQQLAQLEGHPCITKGCEFHGLPENGGRCSACVKEFSKNAKAGDETSEKLVDISSPQAAAAEAPKNTNNRENLSQVVRTEEPRSLTLLPEAPVEQSKCAHPGCDILASRLTFPYCKNHQFKGTIVSTVKDDKAANNVGAYYAKHITPESSPEPRCESHSLESVQVHFNKRCIAGGCRAFGNQALRNMCPSHFEDYNFSTQAKKESSKKISFATSVKTSPRGGHTINKYTDTEIYLLLNRDLCRNRRCAKYGSPSYQGYCVDCYRHMNDVQNLQGEQLQNMKQTLGQKPTERPKSWAPTATSTTKLGLLVDLTQNTQPVAAPTASITRSRIMSETSPVKHSNLNPFLEPEPEHRSQPKRSHEGTAGQFFPEKTMRMLDSTLPQFTQYREPQDPLEDMSMDIRLCETPECRGIQMRNTKYCFTCESKRSPRPALGTPGTMSHREPAGFPASRSGTSSPPLAQSSTAGSFPGESTRAHISQISRSEVNTSFEREMLHTPKCTFPACDNPGVGMNNGLCQECFDLLATKRRTNVQKLVTPRTITSTVTTEAPPSGPTSIIAPSASSVASTSNYVTRTLCKAPGCDMYGTPEKEDYCSQCYTTSRTSFRQERHIGYGEWHREPVSPVDTRPRSEPLSPAITASHCHNHHCYRFGDPAFNGYCSACYNTIGYSNSYGQDIVPVSYAPVFPPVNQSSRDREPSYRDTRVSFFPNKLSIARCKNEYTTGCVNYGNPSCKGYCNSCYIERRLNMY